MDLIACGELLAKQANGHLRQGHGITGVEPLPGSSRGMGRAASEADIKVFDGQTG